MGICGSSLSEEEKASRALSAQAQADHAAEKRKIKLLLLGTGAGGPSGCEGRCGRPRCCLGESGFTARRAMGKGAACAPRRVPPWAPCLPATPIVTPAGAGESGKSTIFKQMKVRATPLGALGVCPGAGCLVVGSGGAVGLWGV
jgi:hypothetical protein